MRMLLFLFLLTATVLARSWWEKDGDLYTHAEGWTIPVGWRAEMDEDTLRLQQGKSQVILTHLDSQRACAEGLAPVFADQRRVNGGKDVPAVRTEREGWTWVRREVRQGPRVLGVIHVLRADQPTRHLVIFYAFPREDLRPPVEALLDSIHFLDVPPERGKG